MGRCPKPAIHPGEKSSCWEVEWCWNSYQVVVSGHQSMDSIFYITLPLAIRNRCFSTPFLLAAGCGEGAFFSQVLAEEQFQSCWILEFREGTSLLLCPTPASWRSPLDWEKSTSLPFLQLLSSCCLGFTAGPRAAYLHIPLNNFSIYL